MSVITFFKVFVHDIQNSGFKSIAHLHLGYKKAPLEKILGLRSLYTNINFGMLLNGEIFKYST